MIPSPISMTLMGLVEGRKGSTTINQIEKSEIEAAAAQVVELALRFAQWRQ